MKEHIEPGDFVVVDQFIDTTRRRVSTFFGDGAAGHVAFADPVCNALGHHVARAARAAMKSAGSTGNVHRGGTYVFIDGPQFSTRAESNVYRAWGVDVIGMTAMPEAKLAREAEICFATLAMATDYDCWRSAEEAVAIEGVLAVLSANADLARSTVAGAAATLDDTRACGCRRALEHAVITDRALIPAKRREDLAVVAGRVLGQE